MALSPCKSYASNQLCQILVQIFTDYEPTCMNCLKTPAYLTILSGIRKATLCRQVHQTTDLSNLCTTWRLSVLPMSVVSHLDVESSHMCASIYLILKLLAIRSSISDEFFLRLSGSKLIHST